MTYEPNGDEWEEEEDRAALDLQMLRDDLVGELQAINQYEEHTDMLDNDEARDLLCHIAGEEKEHVAELMRLIQQLDAEQGEKFKHS